MSSDIERGDTVGYLNHTQREHFGDMVVVNLLSNNRVDVRKAEGSPEIWQEYLVDLFVVRKHERMS